VDVKPEVVEQLLLDGLTASYPNQTDWADADITLLCVDTPTRSGRVYLENLFAAVDTLAAGLAGSAKPHTIVIRSTVPPGTTDRIRQRIELLSGRTIDGSDLGLGVIPEFLRQARAADDFLHPWIHVVGAAHIETGDRLESLLAPFGAPIVRTDVKTAETVKYAHNLFNATKISFFNEFWLACMKLGADPDVVSRTVIQSAEASWNPAYGSRGGFPYGGACLPKDTTAFLAYAEEVGVEMPLLAATIAVNDRMEQFVDGHAVPVMAMDTHAALTNGHAPTAVSSEGHTNGHLTNGAEHRQTAEPRVLDPVPAGKTGSEEAVYAPSRFVGEDHPQD
jgi:UDPglucose 6-dehydrogenase